MDNRAVLLFEQLFGNRRGRMPQQWELVIGLALVNGELTVQRVPQSPELALLHEVANQVAQTLAAKGAHAQRAFGGVDTNG